MVVVQAQHLCRMALLIYDLQRWNFLNGAQLVGGNIFVLYKFHLHTIRDLSLKFGSAHYVGQMRDYVRQFVAISVL